MSDIIDATIFDASKQDELRSFGGFLRLCGINVTDEEVIFIKLAFDKYIEKREDYSINDDREIRSEANNIIEDAKRRLEYMKKNL